MFKFSSKAALFRFRLSDIRSIREVAGGLEVIGTCKLTNIMVMRYLTPDGELYELDTTNSDFDNWISLENGAFKKYSARFNATAFLPFPPPDNLISFQNAKWMSYITPPLT